MSVVLILACVVFAVWLGVEVVRVVMDVPDTIRKYKGRRESR
jgi:hypothetical protein